VENKVFDTPFMTSVFIATADQA